MIAGRSYLLLLVISAVSTWPTMGLAEAPSLMCNGPESVAAGASFQITVTSNNNYVGDVMVVPQSPLQERESIITGPPFTYDIDVPANINAGRYLITAYALVSGPPAVAKCPYWYVNVTGSNAIDSLSVQEQSIRFHYIGERKTISVFGAVVGAWTDLAGSPELLFQSSDNAVVGTRPGATIIATGAGKAQVAIVFRNFTKVINVQVDSGGRGDLNGDGLVDTDDINILNMFLNTQTNISNDARDLNHDGKIDALDARILTTLCTYPRCATHP